MGERMMTLQPDGKQGVNIDRAKYDAIRQAILDSLAEERAISFSRLHEAVSARLSEPFDGSIGWYTTTVKLDLEARGEIERVYGKSPQVVRLVQR